MKKILIFAPILLLLAGFVISLKPGYDRVKPEKKAVVEAVYALGSVETDQEYNLRTAGNQVVKKLYVKEGSTVSENTALLTLDSGLTLRSPFSGVVSSLDVKEGEMAVSSQTLLTVMNLKSFFVQVSLDQESALKVRKGQKAEVNFEGLRKSRLTGEVESIYPSSGEFRVRIGKVPFPQGILPDMTCDVAIETGKENAALVVPARALENDSLLVNRGTKSERIKVEARVLSRDEAEIISGITENDEILILKTKKRIPFLFLALIYGAVIFLMRKKIFKKEKKKEVANVVSGV